MSFVPVKLSLTNFTIRQANSHNTLALSPSPTAVCFAQAAELSDRATSCDGLDFADLANDLEIHLPGLAQSVALRETHRHTIFS